MHEYKRQHLNALNIAAEYLYLKNNPNAEFTPKTHLRRKGCPPATTWPSR